MDIIIFDCWIFLALLAVYLYGWPYGAAVIVFMCFVNPDPRNRVN